MNGAPDLALAVTRLRWDLIFKPAILVALTATLWVAGIRLRELTKDETEGLIFKATSGPGYVTIMENGEYELHNGITEREAIRQLAVAYFATKKGDTPK